MREFMLILLLGIAGGGAGAEEQLELPAERQILAMVDQLDAESPEVRAQAREQLERWAEEAPRYLLSALAEAYRTEESLESVYQLTELLRELAGEVLFYQPRAFLGVNFELVTTSDSREVIHLQSVLAGAPADKAGLRRGDAILEVGGVDVNSFRDSSEFALEIQNLLPREPVELRVLRNGKEFMVEVILAVNKQAGPAGANSQQVLEEQAKIEAWLQQLRPPEQQRPGEPVGHFRLD